MDRWLRETSRTVVGKRLLGKRSIERGRSMEVGEKLQLRPRCTCNFKKKVIGNT